MEVVGEMGGERGQRGEVEVSITPYLYCDMLINTSCIFSWLTCNPCNPIHLPNGSHFRSFCETSSSFESGVGINTRSLGGAVIF